MLSELSKECHQSIQVFLKSFILRRILIFDCLIPRASRLIVSTQHLSSMVSLTLGGMTAMVNHVIFGPAPTIIQVLTIIPASVELMAPVKIKTYRVTAIVIWPSNCLTSVCI